MKTVKEELLEKPVAFRTQPSREGPKEINSNLSLLLTSPLPVSPPCPGSGGSLGDVVQSAEISIPEHRAEWRRVCRGCGRKRTSSTILLAQFLPTELLFKNLYFPFLKYCWEVMNEAVMPAKKTASCPHLSYIVCQICLMLSNHNCSSLKGRATGHPAVQMGNGFLKECLASSKGSNHLKSKESPDDFFPVFLLAPKIYKQDGSNWIKM